jgi:hypothetical protein
MRVIPYRTGLGAHQDLTSVLRASRIPFQLHGIVETTLLLSTELPVVHFLSLGNLLLREPHPLDLFRVGERSQLRTPIPQKGGDDTVIVLQGHASPVFPGKKLTKQHIMSLIAS